MNKVYDFDLLLTGPLAMLLVLALRRFFVLPQRLPRWNRALSWLWVPTAVGFAVTALLHYRSNQLSSLYMLLVYGVITATLLRLGSYRPARTVLLGMAPIVLNAVIKFSLAAGGYQLLKPYNRHFSAWTKLSVLWFISLLLVARNQKKILAAEQAQREEEEKVRQLIAAQNAELEGLVAERTTTLIQQAEELRETLDELQTTQAQLVQSEKMASLGELTAGIAHEIQNPLNFVNNFADVSAELLDELAQAQAHPARDGQLEAELLRDLKQNLQKITQHGQRAAGIVRGMLAHSRASTGERAALDLNGLCEEYLRLAYHGLRARDKGFNATLHAALAPDLPRVQGVGADLGRVLLNLFTNAFYAVRQRQRASPPTYTPTVSVATSFADGQASVAIADNGTGIPEAVIEKIYQPFFTTKPTGEGTGLGLSLSYDIVVKGHGGTLGVISQEGEGTTCTLSLPLPSA